MSIENFAPHDQDPGNITGLPDDDEDIAGFLAKEGLNWDAIQGMSFQRLDDPTPTADETIVKAVENAAPADIPSAADDRKGKNSNEIPIIAGEAMFEALKTADIPEITPLEMNVEEHRYLDEPQSGAYNVSLARHIIRGIIQRNREEINADNTTIDDAILAISEMLTNTERHNDGRRRIILGLTPYRNLFFGVENIAIDNPEDFGITPKAMGNAALGLGIEASELEDDDHNRGLFLVASSTVNGLQAEGYAGLKKDRTISAGITSLPVDAIAKLAKYEPLSPEDLDPMGQPRRTFVWGAFGLDSERARLADMAESQQI